MKLTKELVAQIKSMRVPTGETSWGKPKLFSQGKIAKQLNLSTHTVWRACTKNFCPTCGHKIN